MGKVTTYSALARILNTNPRIIGRILKENRKVIVVPCHRVVKSDGDIGGYSLGVNFKRKLLKLEGVKFSNGRVCRESIIIDFTDIIS